MDNNKVKKQNGVAAEKTTTVQPRKNNKKYLLVLFVGLALIAASFVFKSKTPGSDDVALEVQGQNTQPAEETVKNDQQNYLEGVLQLSDNTDKGNLKLSSDEGEVYLRTSRDFSALIGKSVLVIIEGTLENFRMVDIQTKLEDDGFLKSN